eukprot:579311-Rhodomonas_salina.2
MLLPDKLYAIVTYSSGQHYVVAISFKGYTAKSNTRKHNLRAICTRNAFSCLISGFSPASYKWH